MKKAIDYYKKSVHEDPLLDKGWAMLALVYNEQNEHEKALHYIQKAVALDELNADYWRCFAEINLKLCFFEEAIAAYKTCITLEDTVLDVWISLVDVLCFTEKYQEALAFLNRAKERYVNYAQVYYRLACVFFFLGEKNLSYKNFQKALSIDKQMISQIQLLYPDFFEDKTIRLMILNHQ